MEILNSQHDSTADFMKYLSTHPETNERIKTLKNTKEIKYTYKQNDELVRLFAKLKQSLE
jgi:predicted Zn-dependent protease